MNKNLQVPFHTETGAMLHSACNYLKAVTVFKTNFVFDDELKYVSKDPYGDRVYVASTRDDRIYNMFWSTFDKLIRKEHGVGPTFGGKFTFAKQGAYYGVIPFEE